MKILFTAVLILILFSCKTTDHESEDYGEILSASHQVSIYEVLGNLDWYDKQPLEIRGVASFDFSFESASGIYASKDDYLNWSYGWLVLELQNISNSKYLSLTKLNGEFVTVYGIFHKYRRKKLPIGSENENIIRLCKGICGAAGYIEVIGIRQ